MPIKNRSVVYYEKKAKRLKVKLDDAVETRHRVQNEFKALRDHSHELLTSYLAEIRRQDETLASNNMTIAELNNQLAVEYKLRAEARSDVDQATKLCAEAVAKYNRLVPRLHELEKAIISRDEYAEGIESRLREAEKSIQYRLWQGFQVWRTKVWYRFDDLRAKLRNYWYIRRLNAARVSALNEAGHIPRNLVKMAHAYWEHDQKRLVEDEQIVRTVYTCKNDLSAQDRHYVRKPGLLRRFKIWCGRA